MIIACSVCGATAWPNNSTTPQTFALTHYDCNGRPAPGDVAGEWRCELHRPSRKRPPRAVTLSEALIDFGELVRKSLALLEEELGDDADDDCTSHGAIARAIERHQAEIERGLGALEKIVGAYEPKPAAPKAKRGSPHVNRAGQSDLLAPNAAPASDIAPAEELE